MKDFADKVAVVTGGASGIGLAVTEALVERGAKVVIADIEKGALDGVVARFKAEQGADVTGILTDVTDTQSVEALRDQAIAEYGKVHLLFNNAGVGTGGAMLEFPREGWNWAFDVNLFGVVDGIRAFVPHMLGHGEPAHIINTASMAGMLAPPAMGAYAATKFGVVALSESLSVELTGSNVNVSVLCPGFVKTKIHDSGRNLQHDKYGDAAEPEEEMTEAFAALIAAGIEPDLVARLVLRAIEDERFYIFTHSSLKPALEERFATILSDYNTALALLEEWGEGDADHSLWPNLEMVSGEGGAQG